MRVPCAAQRNAGLAQEGTNRHSALRSAGPSTTEGVHTTGARAWASLSVSVLSDS